jgi:hypothetical protein
LRKEKQMAQYKMLKVKWNDGREVPMKEPVAKELERRGQLKIIGEAKPELKSKKKDEEK